MEININDLISQYTVLHVDQNGSKKYDGHPQSGLMALNNKYEATYIENTDISNISEDSMTIINSCKINYRFDLNPNLKRIIKNKIIYRLPFYRNGDYVENVKIDTKLNLLNVFLNLTLEKTYLKFLKQDDGYIIDVSYIPLISLQFKDLYIILEFQKEDEYEDPDIYFSYGYFKQREPRYTLTSNIVKFNIQGVNYIANKGVCFSECLICNRYDEEAIMKIQKYYRENVYFNPYNLMGKRMIEKKCEDIKKYINNNLNHL